MNQSADARAAKDQPLRDDIHLLGDLLGTTLREQESQALLDRVEQVRAMSKAAHSGQDEEFARLAALLGDVPTKEALPIARAFAHFLNLANIAEQHHRVRRRREYARDPHSEPQPGSCLAVLRELLARGVPSADIFATIRRMQIELVLTAHPTEVARRTLLHKHDRIAQLLATGDRTDLTIEEREQLVSDLRREIASAWETDEVRHDKPSPIDEVKSGLYIFERTLWAALPAYLRTLDGAMQKTIGEQLPIDVDPVRFGSWIGGDRDGNPSVTSQVTEEACLLSRWMAADLYLRDLEMLRDELSMSHCSAELRRAAGDAREPYRAVIKGIERKLAASKAAIEQMVAQGRWERGAQLVSRKELLDALLLCHRSLVECDDGIIAGGRLLDLIRRAHCFGTTLVRLDIRQDAARHTRLLAALTRASAIGDYREWDEERRLAFLLSQLNEPDIPLKLDTPLDDDDAETMATFRMIGRVPRESFGAYVITMASTPSDVLAVALLQRIGRVAEPLRIVPLFETNADLRGAAETMRELLTIPWYRQRIRGKQEVMIGYSDSSKDAGRFAAAWALYEAQEKIVQVCREEEIELTLFHGRGGSVGRGGGPTWLAIESQPPGSIDGRLRVTVQGEMIQANFGLPEIAVRTLEIYTTATLDATLAPSAAPRQEWRDLMKRLSDLSRQAYREVVYERAEFIPYFRAVTPEVELGTLNIGSRPARRGGAGGGVESLRAIPWQFAWTQTRLMLSSWLGVEAALEEALKEPNLPLVRAMFAEWPFFRSTIELMEMVLAKTDARIARQYERSLAPAELHPVGEELRVRLHRAVRYVREITGRELLQNNPTLRRSINVRNPYVDPINLTQIEILRRYRAANDESLWDAFVVTVNGIAAGMRNTG